MSNLKIDGVRNLNDYEELVRMFYPDGEAGAIGIYDIPEELLRPIEKKDEIKKLIYETLTEMTGKTLKWGTLTGVKPLKLYNKLLRQNDEDKKAAGDILRNDYLVNEDKIKILEEIHSVQREILGPPQENEVSIYIGIPFCPTRCTYCSFVSNQKDYSEIKRYLGALYKEIDYVAGMMQKKGLIAESIYVGGGTPTTLEATELEDLLKVIKGSIPVKDDFEFTVEAGRPDTITDIKLTTLNDNGVNRISINPQTMKDETLVVIGRDHCREDVRKAFEIEKRINFKAVNTDVIAGLPGEDPADFVKTLEEILEYEPENITVHTLALKKSSKLMEAFIEEGDNPIDEVLTADEMVDRAATYMADNGYRPYYIYRQKYMADNLENVGYAKPGTECIYNIRIMEEKQTVIAMGAGGSSKVYFPGEDRLERVMNVSNYEIYIDRIDEMIERKQNKLFI